VGREEGLRKPLLITGAGRAHLSADLDAGR
jgi:hypothetical protein